MINRTPLTNEYTLICRKCGMSITVNENPSNELKLCSLQCQCEKVVIPEPIPQVITNADINPEPIKKEVKIVPKRIIETPTKPVIKLKTKKYRKSR